MIKFIADDQHGVAVEVSSNDESMVTWPEQMKLFFSFLKAQGFLIPDSWEEAAFEAMEEMKELDIFLDKI